MKIFETFWYLKVKLDLTSTWIRTNHFFFQIPLAIYYFTNKKLISPIFSGPWQEN